LNLIIVQKLVGTIIEKGFFKMDFKSFFVQDYLERLHRGEYISPEFDSLVNGVNNEMPNLFHNKVLSERGKSGGVPSGGIPDLSPRFTNRGVDRRNENLTESNLSPVCMGGYDGGNVVGFYGVWNPDKFLSLVNYLEKFRKNESERKVIINGIEFLLYPFGANGGIHYRYVLEGFGLKVYIHHNPGEQIQPIRVRYGFESVVGRNFFDVHSEFLFFLSSIGFEVSKEVLSNVEMQVMVVRDISEFMNLVLNDFCVRSFFKCNWYTDSSGNLSGILGGVGVKIRIYNKSKELIDTRAELKSSLLSNYCLGGDIPVNLTRVEYSLGRDFLNDCKIDSVLDLKAYENSLVKYLTHDWFRLLAARKSRGNASRQSIHEIWQEVQNLFDFYFPGFDLERHFSRNSRSLSGVSCSSKMLNSQAIGCLCSAISLSHGVFRDKEQVRNYILNLFDSNSDLIMKKIKSRVERNRVLTGYDPSVSERDYLDDPVFDTIDYRAVEEKRL
jgi:hypothetical protein